MIENNIYELQYAIDTFYFLVTGALVMWMAAGFTMLEAGLVRSKNTAEIMTKNVALFSIACIMYLFIGYELMYDGGVVLFDINDNNNLVSNALIKLNQNGFSGEAVYSKYSDFFFQAVFVATSMSIVSGAVAERMKLWSFLVFTVIMTALIYPLEGSWTWGGKKVFGLFSLNLSDFAGSGIVHMAGASAALAGVIVLGARKGKYGKNGQIYAIPGANMPLATLGVFILWMGWLGFNGGSVLKLADIVSANSVAIVFLNTNTAAAGGALGALIIAKLLFGKADLTMLLNGALAGLVVVTAEPLTPTPLVATLFGFSAGIIVVFSIIIIDKLRIDDPVGAISVHGVLGFIGLMIVPLTNHNINFQDQFIGAIVIFAWVFTSSILVWLLLKYTIGIRISADEEEAGCDLTECGLEAYPEFTESSD